VIPVALETSTSAETPKLTRALRKADSSGSDCCFSENVSPSCYVTVPPMSSAKDEECRRDYGATGVPYVLFRYNSLLQQFFHFVVIVIRGCPRFLKRASDCYKSPADSCYQTFCAVSLSLLFLHGLLRLILHAHEILHVHEKGNRPRGFTIDDDKIVKLIP